MLWLSSRLREYVLLFIVVLFLIKPEEFKLPSIRHNGILAKSPGVFVFSHTKENGTGGGGKVGKPEQVQGYRKLPQTAKHTIKHLSYTPVDDF